MSASRTYLSGVCLALGLSLTGCDTGDSLPRAGDPDRPLIIGAVQHVGSIQVNDQQLTTGNSQVTIEGSFAEVSELRPGQRVIMSTDSSQTIAIAIQYDANLLGPAANVSLAGDSEDPDQISLEILGQPVITDAMTIVQGAAPETIENDQLLEISGTRNADGILVASYIAVHGSMDYFKVIGEVTASDSSGFQIGDLAVDSRNALLFGFGIAGPTTGDLVTTFIETDGITGPDAVVAEEVQRIPGIRIAPDQHVRVQGYIGTFNSPENFRVANVPITTDDETQYVNGDVDALANNRKVLVRGTIDPVAGLLAQQIDIYHTRSIRVSAPVTAIDEAEQTIDILGLSFDVRALTRFDDKRDDTDPFGLGDLQSSDYLRVRGYADGDVLYAQRVRREDTRDRARLQGPVTAFDFDADEISILGQPLSLQDGVTVFEEADGSAISRTEFINRTARGVFIRAHWDHFGASTDPVDALRLIE